MKSKEILVKRLTNKLQDSVMNKSFLQTVAQELKQKYDLPLDYSFDYLALKKDLDNETDNVLFYFTDIIDPKSVSKHFFEKEIEQYKTTKYKVKNVRFPLRIPMIQISDDQWIGKITAKELMRFRDAHLINYNENAQRTMQHIIKGDIEYYRIALNKTAVKKIEELYSTGNYIPNTITLNMPEETSEFEYDDDTKELVIRKLEYFDIIDGYHRYIAISNLSNLSKFEYPMELRITWFGNERAQQMIWQEDQKTRMSKVDSESYNHNLYANKIVDYLNLHSNLSGNIVRNGGLIDASLLSNVINGIYFRKISDKEAKTKWIVIRNTLTQQLNDLVENNPNLMKTKWSYSFILATVFSFFKGRTNYLDIKKLHNDMKGDPIFNKTSYQLFKNQLGKLNTIEGR